MSDVVIDDDPALSAEPIAYVGQLQAVPRLWSLFTGRLQFSSLRLEDTNLNLSRADVSNGEYRWNVETLLRPAVVAAFPNISLRGGRINFKAGNVKSMVYLLDSDLDVQPPSSSGKPWRFRFQGQPARADRPARGSGALRASGDWLPGSVDLDLELESSELGDMVALLRGEDIGLHGLISGRAKLKGPTTDVQLEGRLRVEDLHGWDQSIPKGESWPLDLHGRWNMPAQRLELDARVRGKDKPILNVHYLVQQYVTQPRWGVSVELTHFGVEPLLPLARHLGLALPEGLQFTGLCDGVVSYSARENFQGQGYIAPDEARDPRVARAAGGGGAAFGGRRRGPPDACARGFRRSGRGASGSALQHLHATRRRQDFFPGNECCGTRQAGFIGRGAAAFAGVVRAMER